MADQAEDLRRLALARLAWREMTGVNNQAAAVPAPEPTEPSTKKTRWADYSDFFDGEAQAGWSGRPIHTRDRVP